MQNYQFLEHPADLKIRAFGKDLPKVFINAALAMQEFLYAKQTALPITAHQEIVVEAENLESLLVNWLAEILWLSDTKHCRVTNYRIKEFSEHKIIAEVSLVKAKAEEDIKAVTYHDLKIKKEKDFWIAEVVFDI